MSNWTPQVGERVSVHLDDGNKYRGTIKKLMPYENLQIDLHGTGSPIVYPIVHPKQCRRLVKRRRVWVDPKFLDHGTAQVAYDESRAFVMSKGILRIESTRGWVEMMEVRKRK